MPFPVFGFIVFIIFIYELFSLFYNYIIYSIALGICNFFVTPNAQ